MFQIEKNKTVDTIQELFDLLIPFHSRPVCVETSSKSQEMKSKKSEFENEDEDFDELSYLEYFEDDYEYVSILTEKKVFGELKDITHIIQTPIDDDSEPPNRTALFFRLDSNKVKLNETSLQSVVISVLEKDTGKLRVIHRGKALLENDSNQTSLVKGT